ncbi:MAG: glycosyltransferase [Bacteroidota bacterium]
MRVLVAVLNWGLGHATRCMPIINALLSQGAEVHLASDGRAGRLLCQEFPTLPYYELPAYNIHYKTANMLWNIGWQMPRIARTVYKEYKVIRRLAAHKRFDLLISDNRFGCRIPGVRNVFMTHQVNIQIPIRLLEWIVGKFNRAFIQPFDVLWIPDVAALPGLAGRLSHGGVPSKAVYLGPLSRFVPIDCEPRYDIIAILSGPEPQRSFFEEKILSQAVESDYRMLVVKGQTELEEHYFLTEKVELVSYLNAKALNEAIARSRLVLSRPGYSTVMDLSVLGKKAILVPTPGQTEQEYLAEELQRAGLFFRMTQADFHLEEAVRQAKRFSGFRMPLGEAGALKKAVQALLANE